MLDYKVLLQNKKHLVFTKNLRDRNCVKIFVKDVRSFDLYEHAKDAHWNSFTIDMERQQPLEVGGTKLFFIQQEQYLATKNPYTHKSYIFDKGELMSVALDVPFIYDRLQIKFPRETIKVYLKEQMFPHNINVFSYYDYLIFVLELLNNLIILDVAVALLIWNSYRKIYTLHSVLLWWILFWNIIIFLFYIMKYQLDFYTNVYLFLYFLCFMGIILANVQSTAGGMALFVILSDPYVHYNTKDIKRTHRKQGYLLYALLKLQIVLKCVMLLYFFKLPLERYIAFIFLGNIAIWIFLYLKAKILDKTQFSL